jgi:phenylalanine-4-hydroxylase
VETLPAPGDVDRSSPPSDPQRSIPDYLQPFIVDQDSSRYTAIDQAVWRFVLLQLHSRLERTAHPSYARGLVQSGISPEHIPSIGQMNAALSSIGWRAVCVDGFIPPRAFQAFQALGILPIAAEIRSPDQLPYTPAPDIIHEAAGHAPILVDPNYAAYIRASGQVAARAFASPADGRVDRAVRRLSEVKEAQAASASDVEAAASELASAVAEQGQPSESTRLSRLYWWTAEYGLVGSPEDYRLYGAGLLSSLGESHFCHRPEVRKLPLSAACTDVGYDITRPQPQLFVAENFEHLHSVLAEVSQTLAYDIGGQYAVRTALASQELCSLYLPGDVQAIGKLTSLEGEDSSPLLGFAEGVALAQRGRLLGRVDHEYFIVLGHLADGTDPRQIGADGLGRYRDSSGRVTLCYGSGAELSGRPCGGPWDGQDAVLWLSDFKLRWRGRLLVSGHPAYPLLSSDRVITAAAGSACAEVSPLDAALPRSGRFARARVPKPKTLSPSLQKLERLYREVARVRPLILAPDAGGEAPAALLGLVHAELEREFPHEWLLRWNVLDCLIRLGGKETPLARDLGSRLTALEHHYEGQHPIQMGLDYLMARS